MSKPKSISLLIAGVYTKSEAYPNVVYRIHSLIEHSHILVKEINCGLLNKNNNEQIRTAKNPILFFICHTSVYLKVIFHHNEQYLYIPYPSIFLQTLISLLPKILKPEFIIIDAFISLYDTIVIDRKLISKKNWLAKLIYIIEHRAFTTANYVIVDTICNRNYYSTLYHLPLSKFIPIELATDEINFKPLLYKAENHEMCQILFIGTLIPLHGIQIIIKAIKILEQHKNLQFKIIGDGQDASYIENYLKSNPDNLIWQRNWHSSEMLSSEIAKADICLGIFGTTPKTQRVCPYKIYHYSRIGRSVITAKTEWTNLISADEDKIPFMLVNSNDPEDLADKILDLANSPTKRLSLANKSQTFYVNHLSVMSSTNKLIELFKNII
jgi:glycosyltransferase involved in cell wall biosynthesis